LLAALSHKGGVAGPGGVAQPADQQHVRMFVLSHLCGPFIGLALSAVLALLGFPPDYRMIGFTALICLFWVYPLALARGANYRMLSFSSLQHLTLVILWASHGYGGLISPFLLWLAVVPLLAFLYLSPGRRLWLILVLMLAGNVAAFTGCALLVSVPPAVEEEALRWLALLSLLGASAYVSMMAIYFGRVLSSRDEMEREAARHRAVAARLDRVAIEMRQRGAAKAASVARIGRDCQAPLSDIVLSCKSMLDEEPADGGDTSGLSSIAEAARYLGLLIEDIDQYARLESRVERSEPTSFDLDALLKAVIAQASPRPGAGTMTIEGDPLVLRSDRALLEQALVQVIRHLRQPNIAPALRLRTTRVADGARHKVAIDIFKDDKPAAVQHEASAEPRLETDRPAQASGHGLSLILARRICSLLGGTLTAHPSLPAGAGFRLRLPLAV
jgi:signal transduction histidine kinase